MSWSPPTRSSKRRVRRLRCDLRDRIVAAPSCRWCNVDWVTEAPPLPIPQENARKLRNAGSLDDDGECQGMQVLSGAATLTDRRLVRVVRQVRDPGSRVSLQRTP